MSEFESFDDSERFGNVEVYQLAEELDEATKRSSPEYKSGLADSISFSRSTTDIGGETEAKVTFVAERMIDSAELDADIPTEFTVDYELKLNGLTIESFPNDVWELLRYTRLEESDEAGEYVPDEEWLEELHDEDTTFSIGYRHGHTVTTEGNIFPHEWVIVYINGEEIYLPEHRQDLANAASSLNKSSESMPEKGFSDLEAIFTPEEIASFRDIGNQVLAELSPTKLVNDLYDHIESVRYRTTQMRVSAIRNIMKEVFPDLAVTSGDD